MKSDNQAALTEIKNLSKLIESHNKIAKANELILSMFTSEIRTSLIRLETEAGNGQLRACDKEEVRTLVMTLATERTQQRYVENYLRDYLLRQKDNKNFHYHPFLGNLNNFAQELYDTWYKTHANPNPIVRLLDTHQNTQRRHSTQSLEEERPHQKRSFCCLFPWREKLKPTQLIRQARFIMPDDRKTLVTP